MMQWIHFVSFTGFCYLVLRVGTVQYSNRWSVEIDGGNEEADRLATKHGFINEGKILNNYYSFQHRKVITKSRVPATHVQEGISAEPNVNTVQQQAIKTRKWLSTSTSKSTATFPPRDTNWAAMWYINRDDGPTYNVIEVWKKGITGQGVVVAVVDEGFDPDHPEIKDNYDKGASWDLLENDTSPLSRNKLLPQRGHGENCAGVIAAVANNNRCGLGLAYDVKIGGIRLFHDEMATDAQEATALSFQRNYIDIYSNSWGPGNKGYEVDGPGRLTQIALAEGAEKGRNGKGSIYVFAAGNGGSLVKDCCAFNGYVNSIYTVAITGVNRDGVVPSYGEHCAGIMAVTYSRSTFEKDTSPVVTAGLGDKCDNTFGGSSAAAVMASGLIALTLSANNDLTWRDVQHIIVRSARPAAVKGVKERSWTVNKAGLRVNDHVGFGLMDASKMVSLAANWSTVPEKSSCNIESIGVTRQISSFEPLDVSVDLTDMERVCNGVMINFLEHVEVKLNLNYTRRGDLEIKLTSPSGTETNLTHYRLSDSFFRFKELKNWVVMTLHLWGETAKGEWKLTIKNSQTQRANKGILFDWSLILHGTKDNPLDANTHLLQVPDSRHPEDQLTTPTPETGFSWTVIVVLVTTLVILLVVTFWICFKCGCSFMMWKLRCRVHCCCSKSSHGNPVASYHSENQPEVTGKATTV